MPSTNRSASGGAKSKSKPKQQRQEEEPAPKRRAVEQLVVVEEEDEDERMLKTTLFGGREWFGHDETGSSDKQQQPNEALFSVDTEGESSSSNAAGGGGAAWADSDDEDVVVNLAETDRLRKLRHFERETTVSGTEFTERLREQHARLASANNGKHAATSSASGGPAWAQVPSASSGQLAGAMDEDEAVLRQTSSLLAGNGAVGYAKRKLDHITPDGRVAAAKKLADVCQRGDCVVQALDWFPQASNVFLTAGLDKTLRLFQLKGRQDNKLVQSVFFDDLPISSAQFAGSAGQEIILTGNKPYFYTYDVEAGKLSKISGVMIGRRLTSNPRAQFKALSTFTTDCDSNGSSSYTAAFATRDGYVSLVDGRTKMETGYLRSGTLVTDLRFVNAGGNLITAGSDGEVRNWDRRQLSRPVWKRVDGGSTIVTALACTDSMYAVGSDNGMVSVYSMEHGTKLKQSMHLMTCVQSLDFSGSGALLAMSSREQHNALKVLHMPTGHLVVNFPDPKARLQRVQQVRFSKRGGMLSCGNDRGNVALWKGFNV